MRIATTTFTRLGCVAAALVQATLLACSAASGNAPGGNGSGDDGGNPGSQAGEDGGGTVQSDAGNPVDAGQVGKDVASPADGGASETGASDTGSSTPPSGPPASGPTSSGVPVPSGWTLKGWDKFGTGAGSTVTTFAELHAKYYEAQFYNRGANGLVDIPNTVINGEQETYSHFETAIAWSPDHLTIQGRGQSDGSITSAEMVSIYTARSFCTEAKYRIPSATGSWPAFWFYGSTSGGDSSEIDVEQPITPNQGVTSVSMYNHPSQSNVVISDPLFTTQYMTWTNPAFDGSAAPHTYTACYDDSASQLTRYIDGKKIYSATFQWNASLGGTGHGPDATTIVNLAVGGSWPGNVANPSSYSGDLDLYYIEYYGP